MTLTEESENFKKVLSSKEFEILWKDSVQLTTAGQLPITTKHDMLKA